MPGVLARPDGQLDRAMFIDMVPGVGGLDHRRGFLIVGGCAGDEEGRQE